MVHTHFWSCQGGPEYEEWFTDKDFFSDDGDFIMHQDLLRHDGLSFLIVRKPRTSYHFQKIDDPFFAAHRICPKKANVVSVTYTYCPNYEATALGCVEQYEYCLRSLEFCTPWRHQESQFAEINERLLKESHMPSLEDLWIFGVARMRSSVHSSLAKNDIYNTVQLTHTRPRKPSSTHGASIHPKEQLVKEVKFWFTKGIVNSILAAQFGAQSKLRPWL